VRQNQKCKIIVFPAMEYSEEYYRKDFENAVEELQEESIANGNSDMTMEEINFFIYGILSSRGFQ